MAIKQYSRRLTLQLAVVLLLGWLLLIIWSVSQWLIHDYAFAYHKINTLIETQRIVIKPIAQGSLLAALPFDINPKFSFTHPYLTKLSFNAFTADLLQKSQQFLQLVILASQCVFIKIMILMAAIPLFALALSAGMVDGLNQRAIRTACLGRESSYVFHQLNRYFHRGLIILFMVWLVLPISITPAFIFIPVSLLMGIMMAMTASRFKKYL